MSMCNTETIHCTYILHVKSIYIACIAPPSDAESEGRVYTHSESGVRVYS